MKIRVVEINDLAGAAERIAGVGADRYSVRLMAKKAVHRALLCEDVDNRAANFLKQDMLSIGGEAAVSRDVGGLKKGKSSVLVMGTLAQLERLSDKITRQPFGLALLSRDIKKALLISGKPRNAPRIMGILNITPDSFSDGGNFLDRGLALEHASRMASEGADIIDIGGESSRPGSTPVSEKEELRRVLPVIRAVAGKLKVKVSIDTYKPAVARAAVGEGATIINDISGLRHAGGMAAVAAKSGASVVIMHMLGKPRTMQKNPSYVDVVSEICGFFRERMEFALDKGIKPGRIMLDPGLGFGKKLSHNIEILGRFGEFKSLGVPVVAGVSRKSFIGALTGVECPADRISGSISAAVWCALNGADILRVHDVRETAEALKIIKAVRG
jgi:dihydropteroate synthase